MKLSDKIYLLVVTTTLFLMATVFTGCKSSKHTNCDAYSDTYLIRTDSMIVKVEHCHIPEKNYCFYDIDTIRLTK